MLNLLAKKSTYTVLNIVGFIFLFGYLIIARDFRFSTVWLLGYFLIAAAVPLIMMVILELPKRFPKLDRYHFAKTASKAEPLSESEWVLKQLKYTKSGFTKKSILRSPSEDGLVCVPIILVGISPTLAILGGLVFGLLHLGRFTYLDCIGKAILYSLVCLLILPHGLLTVIAGHFTLNLFVWGMLTLTMSKLSRFSGPQ